MATKALLGPSCRLGEDISGVDIATMAFQRTQADGTEPYLISDEVEMAVAPLEVIPPDATVQRAVSTPRMAACYATTPTASMLIISWSQSARYWVSASTLGAATELMKVLRCRMEVAVDELLTTIRTWHCNDRGPDSEERSVNPPAWADIACNYPPKVAGEFERVVGLREPSGGRLILLHGPPGTGKSTAIKALSGEWRSWCTSQVITDPERLFFRPNYLQCVVQSASARRRPPLDKAPPDAQPRWSLIIAEDADEFLRSTARRDAGAALGRLINFTDGINTDSHGALVLLTTNEDIGRLHPALTRPGRCLASIRFDTFTVDEARQWLPPDVPRPNGRATLAELLVARGDLLPPTGGKPDQELDGPYL